MVFGSSMRRYTEWNCFREIIHQNTSRSELKRRQIFRNATMAYRERNMYKNARIGTLIGMSRIGHACQLRIRIRRVQRMRKASREDEEENREREIEHRENSAWEFRGCESIVPNSVLKSGRSCRSWYRFCVFYIQLSVTIYDPYLTTVNIATRLMLLKHKWRLRILLRKETRVIGVN